MSEQVDEKASKAMAYIYEHGRTYQIFNLLLTQKLICFDDKDIEEHGKEILEAAYLEGHMKGGTK